MTRSGIVVLGLIAGLFFTQCMSDSRKPNKIYFRLGRYYILPSLSKLLALHGSKGEIKAVTVKPELVARHTRINNSTNNVEASNPARHTIVRLGNRYFLLIPNKQRPHSNTNSTQLNSKELYYFYVPKQVAGITNPKYVLFPVTNTGSKHNTTVRTFKRNLEKLKVMPNPTNNSIKWKIPDISTPNGLTSGIGQNLNREKGSPQFRKAKPRTVSVITSTYHSLPNSTTSVSTKRHTQFSKANIPQHETPTFLKSSLASVPIIQENQDNKFIGGSFKENFYRLLNSKRRRSLVNPNSFFTPSVNSVLTTPQTHVDNTISNQDRGPLKDGDKVTYLLRSPNSLSHSDLQPPRYERFNRPLQSQEIRNENKLTPEIIPDIEELCQDGKCIGMFDSQVQEKLSKLYRKHKARHGN